MLAPLRISPDIDGWTSSSRSNADDAIPVLPSAAVTDIVERRVGDLVVRLDRLLCVGFGDCIEVAPALWEFDSEGVVTFREPLPEIEREVVIRSCEICPVDALTVVDASGQVVVG